MLLLMKAISEDASRNRESFYFLRFRKKSVKSSKHKDLMLSLEMSCVHGGMLSPTALKYVGFFGFFCFCFFMFSLLISFYEFK